jgi:hypothetical protein
MADNVVLDVGTGGDTIAADDVAGVKYQLVQLVTGADAGAKSLVTGTAGLPVGIQAGTNNIGDVDVLTVAAGVSIEVMGDVAHDAAASAVNPILTGGYASAAAPANVSADADAVRAWHLLSGACCVQMTAAGALIAGDAANGLDVDVTRLPALVAGTANIGDVDVLTVPADPFGVNADAASATGSISAKLRFIAGTGIPVTGSVAVTNAGTFVVQENGAALTALQLIDNLVLAEDAAHASADPGVQLLAVRKATPVTLSGADGDYEPLQISVGRLWCSATVDTALPTGTNNIGDVDVLTLPALVAGTANIGDVDVLTIAAGDNNIGNVDIVTVPADPFGANADAASGTGSISAKLRSIAVTGIPITGTVTVGSHDVTNAGTFAVQAAQSGTWTVQPGNTANTTPWLVNDRPDTTGGLTLHKTISAATTNATNIKASAGQVYSVQVFNTNASPRYLKLYNKASSPTVGTDVPVKTLLIPGNANGAGMVLNWDKGLTFTTGIAFALTTGIADTDTGAVAANEIAVNLDYK